MRRAGVLRGGPPVARLAFERLTRDEIGAIAPDSVALLPTAAIEQHGPQCPVGLDTMCCSAVANAAADAVGDDVQIVVCPPQSYGSSHHHLPFPGVLTLTSQTFAVVLGEILESLWLSGFRRVLVLNGHGGNKQLIQQAARDFVLQHHDMRVSAGCYWDIARDALEAVPTPQPVHIPGHGGDFETALMLHLHPDLIHTELIPVEGSTPNVFDSGLPNVTHAAWQGMPGARATGLSDDVAQATAELGRQYFETAVAEVAKLLRGLAEGA